MVFWGFWAIRLFFWVSRDTTRLTPSTGDSVCSRIFCPTPGIAVDVHVLNLAKALGIVDFDCEDQELVQNTMESLFEKELWPTINLKFGGLFQFLHQSRGEREFELLYKSASTVGPHTLTKLQLFIVTKRLISCEGMKKVVGTISMQMLEIYNFSMNR